MMTVGIVLRLQQGIPLEFVIFLGLIVEIFLPSIGEKL